MNFGTNLFEIDFGLRENHIKTIPVDDEYDQYRFNNG